DFRTKLLSLLPLASGIGVFAVFSTSSGVPERYWGPLGLFGFAVSAGLFIYEIRGIQECLELRKSGKSVESALGLTQVQGRFLNTSPNFVGPQLAGWIIYPAVLAGWLYVVGAGFSWKLLPPSAPAVLFALLFGGGLAYSFITRRNT